MAVAIRSFNFLPCLKVWVLCVAYVKFDSLDIAISFPFIKCNHRHPKKRQNFIDFDKDMMTS